MLKISEFFKRIQGKQAKEFLMRSSVQSVVRKYTGVDIPLESISLNSDVVTLKDISQSARSAIFIKKQAILAEINSAQTIRTITGIK